MLFISIKEINMSRKEINRVLSKAMSNTYLKLDIEKNMEKLAFSKLWFSMFKKLVTRSVLGLLVGLMSCCNLKMRGLGAKLCLAFLLC